MRSERLVSLKLKMRAVPGQDCECEDSDKPAHLQAPPIVEGGFTAGDYPGAGLLWPTLGNQKFFKWEII